MSSAMDYPSLEGYYTCMYVRESQQEEAAHYVHIASANMFWRTRNAIWILFLLHVSGKRSLATFFSCFPGQVNFICSAQYYKS